MSQDAQANGMAACPSADFSVSASQLSGIQTPRGRSIRRRLLSWTAVEVGGIPAPGHGTVERGAPRLYDRLMIGRPLRAIGRVPLIFFFLVTVG